MKDDTLKIAIMGAIGVISLTLWLMVMSGCGRTSRVYEAPRWEPYGTAWRMEVEEGWLVRHSDGHLSFIADKNKYFKTN